MDFLEFSLCAPPLSQQGSQSVPPDGCAIQQSHHPENDALRPVEKRQRKLKMIDGSLWDPLRRTSEGLASAP